MKKILAKQNLIMVLLMLLTNFTVSFGKTVPLNEEKPPCIVNIQSWSNPNSGSINLLANLESCDSSNLQLTYEWSTGETTQQIEVAGPGNYCVTITATLLGTTIVNTYEACEDAVQSCGASIQRFGSTLSYTGYGSPVVSALWSTGETTETIQSNGFGIYSVVLTHEGGCISDASINLLDTFCYSIIEVITDPSGALFLQASGAPNENYTVTWYVNGNSFTGPVIALTVPGTYEMVMEYEGGCVSTGYHVYDPSGQCAANIAMSNNGDGTALLYLTGNYGTIAAIAWTQNTDPNNVIELGLSSTQYITAPGEYCFVATNTEGCSFTNCATISIDPVQDSLCYAWISSVINSDNTTTLTAYTYQSGGVFTWSNGTIGNTITVPSDEGEYCVTFSNDSTNCEYTSCITFGEVECDVWITQSQFGTPDVTLTANSNVSGTYLWSTGEISQSIVVSADGTYSVTLTNANGCFVSSSVDIDITNDECNYTINISIDSINGIPSYVVDTTNLVGTYFWSDGTVGPILVGFEPNTGYYMFFTGADGCNITVYVGPGNPTDSVIAGDGSIEGIVTEDPDGLVGIKELEVREGEGPMAGAAVQLIHSGGHVETIITKADGAYKFEDLADGIYDVRFMAAGRVPYTKQVELSGGSNKLTINVTVGQKSILRNKVMSIETLSMYPNPAADYVNIVLKDVAEYTSLNVYDMTGRIVKTISVDPSSNHSLKKVDISSLAPGVYTFRIVSKNKALSGKLIKE